MGALVGEVGGSATWGSARNDKRRGAGEAEFCHHFLVISPDAAASAGGITASRKKV